MALGLAAAAKSAACDAVVDRFDIGGAGTIQIRSGTRPATADTTATGTLLATVTLANPAFGSASSGVATLSDPSAVTAVATGTATWFRGLSGGAAAVFDGDVTATGGGGDLTLASTSITSGQSVDITGGTVTMP